MTAPGFVHLRLHTEFSLKDSVVRVPELMARVAALGMPAVALTDEHNLFALVKFYKAALGSGIKPLVGVDFRIRAAQERAPWSRLTLLCQNDVGYRNLTRLVSRCYLEGQQSGAPQLEMDWLGAAQVAGLIALSGGAESDVGRALQMERSVEANKLLDGWLDLFGDRYYLEVARLGRSSDASQVARTVALAAARDVPLVATNDVRFLGPEDFETHEARVCIHDGALLADTSRPRRYTAEQYLRSPAEMAQLFADLPEALANTVEIAKRCNLTLELGASRLPVFPLPAGLTAEAFLETEAERGLMRRLQAAGHVSAEAVAPYRERLAAELKVIAPMGFASYFLIVSDFIAWAKANGVPVGPGRGSGAGSLVAWALGITGLDPLQHDLLFERFLNPERVSMPDFDIDFCMEGRDRVIEYVADKYGREKVSQIITYGTMAAKAVVRDAGRVLGMSYGYVDRIAKLVPFELEMTLDLALEKEPELKRLYDNDDEIHNLIDLARSLEGLTRNAGKHAGGVVIAPSVLTDFAPLYCESSGEGVVTQFDKDDVEAAGLVKFDFLGLRTLTVIDRAVRTINQARALAGETLIDIDTLAFADKATYLLMQKAQTTAVFQLESRGMKDLIRRLRPETFEHIVALVALFRPGPLQSGMVDDFIARRHGQSEGAIDYLHPLLEPVLKPTYGVILYQEQVMQIAQVLAGYTLGGADLLRRAMGKKKPEEMAKQRSIFVGGAVERGVAEPRAAYIFDLMEKFAGYGFNKSHSAAYAVLSYQTGWLKTHFPAEFMAAVLSADMDSTDKVVTIKDECDHMKLSVLPPDINQSVYEFTAVSQQAVRYGLGAIKGVGAAAVEALVCERTMGGPYQSLEDICRRVDPTKLNRRVFDALIRSGALDSLGQNRATWMARLPAAMMLGEQNTRAAEAGQNDLFGLADARALTAEGAEAARMAQPDWSESVRLAGERETLGLYLTGHPLNRYRRELRHFASTRIKDINSEKPPAASNERGFYPARSGSVVGYVHEIRKRGVRISALLDDRSGRIEVTFSDEVYQQYRDLIVKDAILLVEGSLRYDEFAAGWRLTAKRLFELDRLREQQARRLLLVWPGQADDKLIARLAAILTTGQGGRTDVTLRYRNAAGQVDLEFGPEWRVRANRTVVEPLQALFGADGVDVQFGPPAGNSATLASTASAP